MEDALEKLTGRRQRTKRPTMDRVRHGLSGAEPDAFLRYESR